MFTAAGERHVTGMSPMRVRTACGLVGGRSATMRMLRWYSVSAPVIPYAARLDAGSNCQGMRSSIRFCG